MSPAQRNARATPGAKNAGERSSATLLRPATAATTLRNRLDISLAVGERAPADPRRNPSIQDGESLNALASSSPAPLEPKRQEWPADVRAHMNALLVSRMEQKVRKDSKISWALPAACAALASTSSSQQRILSNRFARILLREFDLHVLIQEVQDAMRQSQTSQRSSKRRSLEQQLREMECEWQTEASRGPRSTGSRWARDMSPSLSLSSSPLSPRESASLGSPEGMEAAAHAQRPAPAGVRPRVTRTAGMDAASARGEASALHQRLDDLWHSRRNGGPPGSGSAAGPRPGQSKPVASAAAPRRSPRPDRNGAAEQRSLRASDIRLKQSPDADAASTQRGAAGATPSKWANLRAALGKNESAGVAGVGEAAGQDAAVRAQAKLAFMAERLAFVREQSVATRQQVARLSRVPRVHRPRRWDRCTSGT